MKVLAKTVSTTNREERLIDYVVLTWNSEATLYKALMSIIRYGKPRTIIVVDRFSVDKTLDIARSLGCRVVLLNKPLGFARFVGAEEAGTHMIGYVDSDVELTEEWILVLNALGDPRFGDVGAFSAVYEGNRNLLERAKAHQYTRYGAFGCTIVKRRLVLEFQDIKKYSSGEDLAFSTFLNKKKLRWHVLPVEVKHHSKLTGIPTWLKYRWQGAGARVAGRHVFFVIGVFVLSLVGIKIS